MELDDKLFRITQENNKYKVEVKKYKWTLFGLKTYWSPYVKISGMDECWEHLTINYARQNLKEMVLNDTYYRFKKSD